MPDNMSEPSSGVILLGDEGVGTGCYVLRLEVRKDLRVRFGRFQGGKPFRVPAGAYLYVGSALGGRGRNALASRLLRHASRSGRKRPHRIRASLIAQLEGAGLGMGGRIPREKKLFWHIDYLLDHGTVEIIGIIAVRCSLRLETRLGELLENEPCSFVLARGLGAQDLPGHTHLLGCRGDETWWDSLPDKIRALS